MSIQPLILKNGVISFPRSAADTEALKNSMGIGTSNFVDVSTNQTINGIKTFTGSLRLPSSEGTLAGHIWRSGDALLYRDGANVNKTILNSAGNLSNLADKQISLNNLVGVQTANRILRSNGTNVVLSQVALDTDVINVLPIANGGTGSNTQNFVDLANNQSIAGIKTFTNTTASTSTTTGGVIIGGGLGVAGNISCGNLVYSNGGVIISGTAASELGTGFGFIRHSSGPLLFYIGTTNSFFFKKGDGAAGGLVSINQDGTITYQQTIPTGSGTTCVFSGGKIIALSSSRTVKENIRDLEVREDILDLINPVTFNYIGQDPIKQVTHGFIVEDLEAVDPSLVTYEKGKAYSIQHSELVAVLWSEVKKLKKIYASKHS